MAHKPIAAIGLQPNGSLTLDQARRYVTACNVRRKTYQVICCDAGPPSPKEFDSSTKLAEWAYARAIATFEQYRDAAVCVGFQTGSLTLRMGRKLITNKVAMVALVLQNERDNPVLAMMTEDDNHRTAARIIGQALEDWDRHAQRLPLSGDPLAKLTKKASAF